MSKKVSGTSACDISDGNHHLSLLPISVDLGSGFRGLNHKPLNPSRLLSRYQRLFGVQEVTDQIRTQTGHLPGVSIAVMGCIVNGPGEMADADFGYVGGAPGGA